MMNLALLTALCCLSAAENVWAHGTVVYPASRIYMCYQNPSSSVCDACGSSIYDWMSVLQPDTDFGNHPAFVPDGQIASGGNGGGNFSCLDALTTDWPTTTLNVGSIDV
ncbi:MAG: lytic polysaccharide monooxygenase, partial [Bacteroidota bacterium]